MKRFFTVIIAAFLTLSLTLSVAAAIRQEDCTALMNAISFIKSDEYKDGEIITRGEFATVITRLWNMSSGNAKTDLESLFAVKAAGKDKNGNLREEEPLTYDEAIYSMLSLADYKVIAESAGGYPYGYRKIASENGLTCSKYGTKSLTWNDTVTLLYKMMYLPMIEVTYGKNIQYSKIDNTTVMYELFGLCETRGIMNACGRIDLVSGRTLSEDTVCIGNNYYNVGTEDYKALLGKYVTVFYKENSGINEVCLIYAEDKNNTLIINAEDEPNYSSSKYTYYSNNKRRVANLERNAAVLYNGHIPRSFRDMTYEPQNGYIELIDNDSDGRYEVIKIYSIDIYKINTVEKTDYYTAIYADDKEPVHIISEKTHSNTKLYDAEGANLRLNKIKEGDVVAVFAYVDNGVLTADTIYASKGTVEGVVTSYSEDEKEICIDNVAYKFHTSVNAKIPSLILGSYRSFVIDYSGKIAYINDETMYDRNKGVGYVLITAPASGGINKKMQVKIFDANGDIRIFSTGKKLYVDGVLKKTDAEIEAALTGKSGMAAYMLNNDSTLRSIDFPEQITFDDSDTNEPMNHLKLVEDNSGAGKNLYWRSTTRSIGESSICSENVKLFILPEDAEAVAGGSTWAVNSHAEDDEYIACAPTDFFKDGRYYKVKTYSYNETGLVDFIVFVQQRGAAADSSTGMVVIKKITYVINPDGNETVKLQVLGENGTEDIICADREIFYECTDGTNNVVPAVGDAVMIVKNYDAKAISIRMVYDRDEDSLTPSYGNDGSTFGTYTTKYVIERGNVFDKRNDRLLVTPKDLSQPLNTLNLVLSDFEAHMVSKCGIIKVNDKGEATAGNAGDIKSYKTHSGEFSKVITGSHSNLRSLVVIYE